MYFGPRGPYGTETEAVQATARPTTETADQRQLRNMIRLSTAAKRAQVDLGSYDRKVLRWLSDADPAIVEVIAAMLDRARSSDLE